MHACVDVVRMYVPVGVPVGVPVSVPVSAASVLATCCAVTELSPTSTMCKGL